MAKARAIIKRLKAVRNIRKITRTMELIATARFKKAMDRATEASAYTKKISEIVADLSQAGATAGAGFEHPLLKPHESEDKAVLLVITANRGLCGGYNGSILREAQSQLRTLRAEGKEVRLEVAGKRGIGFFRFQNEPLDQTYTQFEDRPAFEEVNELASRYIDWYITGEIDRLDVAYMQFQTASRQSPVVQTLLPIGQLSDEKATEDSGPDVRATKYDFYPSPEEILKDIVPAAFKTRLFKCFLDAAVSEQIFRMVAMKGATENADEMIRTFKMKYNRARQSQITSELAEIIGGAAALE